MILTHGANSLQRIIYVDGPVIGGRKYLAVKIGSQVWMAENLDYKFSGCYISTPSNPITGKPSYPAAWYYNNDESTYGSAGRKCGLLYTGYAADYLENNKLSLLPSGWRVPYKSDFDALESFCGTAKAGKLLKSKDLPWFTDYGGADKFGMRVLPAGVYWDSAFIGAGTSSQVWALGSVPGHSDQRYCIYFTKGHDELRMFGDGRDVGAAIRLIKDIT